MTHSENTFSVLISQIGREHAAVLRTLATIREYSAGTSVLQEGGQVNSLWVILDGILAVSIRGNDGRSLRLGRHGKGKWFGDLSLLTGETMATVTKTLPIVMATSSDPVADGHVASLARPGGNITGLSSMAPELGAKRIQLLKEVFPKLAHTLAVLWNPAQYGMRRRFDEANSAAPKLGIGVRSIEVRNLDEIGSAFEAMSKEPPEALVLIADPFTRSQRTRIVEFAAAKRLPAIYDTAEFADAGGLMAYGPDLLAQYRRAAYYVDRIFKGTKPGDLPIGQPTKFELVINMKAAKALGIKIPQSIMLQATRVIE